MNGRTERHTDATTTEGWTKKYMNDNVYRLNDDGSMDHGFRQKQIMRSAAERGLTERVLTEGSREELWTF